MSRGQHQAQEYPGVPADAGMELSLLQLQNPEANDIIQALQKHRSLSYGCEAVIRAI